MRHDFSARAQKYLDAFRSLSCERLQRAQIQGFENSSNLDGEFSCFYLEFREFFLNVLPKCSFFFAGIQAELRYSNYLQHVSAKKV